MTRIATRMRIAAGAAACAGAVILAPLTAAASGPVLVALPWTQTSTQKVTVTWTGVATLQDVGSGGSTAASLACDAVQTAGVTSGVGVDCWLTDNGGVTVPISAQNSIQVQSVANFLASPPATNAGIIPAGNYQLCGFAFYWDALGAFHTLSGTCWT